MNQILDEAEKRIPHVHVSAKEEQARLVAEMRQRIGIDLYQNAKRAFPVIDREVRETYDPFCRRVTDIAMRAGNPTPSPMPWISKIQEGQETGGIKNGLDIYEKLDQRDWRATTQHERDSVVENARNCLRCHDGKLSFLKAQKQQAEDFIKTNEWPGRAVPAILTAGTLPGREEHRGITVKSDFDV
jgi:hypothetical protein